MPTVSLPGLTGQSRDESGFPRRSAGMTRCCAGVTELCVIAVLVRSCGTPTAISWCKRFPRRGAGMTRVRGAGMTVRFARNDCVPCEGMALFKRGVTRHTGVWQCSTLMSLGQHRERELHRRSYRQRSRSNCQRREWRFRARSKDCYTGASGATRSRPGRL